MGGDLDLNLGKKTLVFRGVPFPVSPFELPTHGLLHAMLPVTVVLLGSLCTEGPLSGIPRSISSSNIGGNPRLSATLWARELVLESPRLNPLPETLGAVGRGGGGHWWEERVREMSLFIFPFCSLTYLSLC